MAIAQQELADELAKGADANPRIVDFLERQAQAQTVDFKTAQRIRSDSLADARATRARIATGEGTSVEAALRDRINQAIEADLEEFATRAGGDILTEFRRANQLFRDGVLPFQKDRTLIRIADTDTDTVISQFIKRDQPRLAQKLSGNLDQRGQQALKFVVMDDAFRRSLNDAGEFVPQRFARRLEQLRRVNEVIFDEKEIAELTGFVRLAQAANRAGRDAGILGSGLGVGGLGAAGLARSADAAVGAGTGIGVLSLLLTSGAGRRLLTRANRGTNPALVNEAIDLTRRLADRTAQRALVAGQEEIEERVIGAN